MPSCTWSGVDAYSVYDYKSPRIQDADNLQWPFKGSGYMVICPGSGTMKNSVSLTLTANPPGWGRVGGNPVGDPLPGFGCDGLGDRDSGYMEGPGSTMLHEFMQ